MLVKDADQITSNHLLCKAKANHKEQLRYGEKEEFSSFHQAISYRTQMQLK